MSAENTTCSDKGLLLPIFEEEGWHKGVRGFLYMLCLLWVFFGVAIVADAFMCGIEHITSKTRKIQIPDPVKKDAVKFLEVKVSSQ
jgi:solute carrier family 8 (sodium/calcium exchanger)